MQWSLRRGDHRRVRNLVLPIAEILGLCGSCFQDPLYLLQFIFLLTFWSLQSSDHCFIVKNSCRKGRLQNYMSFNLQNNEWENTFFACDVNNYHFRVPQIEVPTNRKPSNMRVFNDTEELFFMFDNKLDINNYP